MLDALCVLIVVKQSEQQNKIANASGILQTSENTDGVFLIGVVR